MSAEYTGKHIRVASDLEQIRDNIHLFAGEDGDKNPNHLINEILHNAIDEIAEGYGDTIEISITEDSEKTRITIFDNGRGIPYEKKDGIYVPYLITTKLATSGKGKSQENKGYQKPTAGLHGYGLTLVNALSKEMRIISIRNYTARIFRLQDGKIHPEYKDPTTVKSKVKTGTIVSFIPDPKYFESIKVDLDSLVRSLAVIKYNNPNIKLKLTYNEKEVRIPIDFHEYIFNIKTQWYKTCENVKFESFCIEIGLSLSELEKMSERGKSASLKVTSIVNNILIEQGTHIKYGINLIKNALYNIAKKKKIDISKEDIGKGLLVLININILQKDFNSQDKKTLTTNPKYYKIFNRLQDKLEQLFLKQDVYDNFTKQYLEILHAYKLRISTKAITKTDRTKGKIYRRLGIKNLQDCLSTDIKDTVLYIVEGESAGGHLSRIRDVNKHAVYYLTGKPINAANFKLQKLLSNKVITDLIQVLGVGYKSNQKSKLNFEDIRYEKIVILSDADPDGLHIRNLLLTLFGILFPDLLIERYVYISEQPLYKVYINKTKYTYVYSQEELEKYKGYRFKRFKGLGEMEASDLKETLYNTKWSRYVLVESTQDTIKELISLMKSEG